METLVNSVQCLFPLQTAVNLGIEALKSPTNILYLLGIFLILLIFMVGSILCIRLFTNKLNALAYKNAPQSGKRLTPTQRFILAASSPSVCNNYKCVIDIWGTHTSATEADRAKALFEWGWGDFTYENAKNMADDCQNRGYNLKYKEYLNASSSPEITSKYTNYQLSLFKEMKQKYPSQGMLAWDLVRVLSIVGGAYMGGIMEYKEAAEIAFEACELLQKNFSSWDDMVGSYTLGYQFWRGKRKKDRLRHYKSLKKTWIYNIAWNTPLKKEEL